MAAKKILIFSLAYFPKHVGGAEVSIKEITDRISDIEFHMVTNRFDSALPKVEKIGNVLVHRVGIATKDPSMANLRKFPLHLNKFLFQLLAAWTAWRLHREHQYDGIWAVMAHSCGVPAALFKVFAPRVPYVLTLQEGDPPEQVERTMRPVWPLFARAFTSADAVTAISTFLGRWARRRGFKGALTIVPNAVDVEFFSQGHSEESINEIRDTFGKRAGDVFVVTTSRLVYKNAVDDVIRALSLLPRNVHFIILGIGPDEAKLKGLVGELDLSERVRFLGQIGHDEMPKYLKACDIFIRASRSEGMGNSFVEAMAAGLPVIATQEGGLSDFLFDEKRNPGIPTTGWAVDKNSPTEIAAAVKDIMGNPEKVRTVVATAKRMVIERYDWNLVAKDMREKVFNRVLGKSTVA